MRPYGARVVALRRELRRLSRPDPVPGQRSHPLHRFSAPYTHLARGRRPV